MRKIKILRSDSYIKGLTACKIKLRELGKKCFDLI